MLSDGRLLPAFGIGSPLGPEWQALGIDTKTRGRKTDECLEIIRRLWREESVDFDGAFYKLKGATIAPKPVQPDLPMWIGGSTDAAIRRTARIGTGWLAGGDPPAEAGRVVAAIKAAATEAGRSIDEDHYGAGFAFHFGSRDAPGVGRAMDAYAKRTGRDATHAFAVGDADTLLARVAEYVDAGVSKFILRPLGVDDDAILAQTHLLIEQVLPRAEARWPRRSKISTTDSYRHEIRREPPGSRATSQGRERCASARPCFSPTTRCRRLNWRGRWRSVASIRSGRPNIPTFH
jgi:alkanesulfonate monooxygenase SsuD/methylene tetrahydromethanopterin reductase-like flavin-dependent oxidoreductase (luciferase family)